MILYLDDITGRDDMFPFGQTKSVAHVRIGMFTILERWQLVFGDKVLLKSASEKPEAPHVVVPALEIPTVQAMRSLAAGRQPADNTIVLNHAADIFKYNDRVLRQDFDMAAKGNSHIEPPEHIFVHGEEQIYIEPGAQLERCFINATDGPVYIASGALIMEGAMLRGPLFIGKKSVIKMGAKIYGSTTIGPGCTAGGEIKNSVMMGYSNKAHDGYLGDSVLGEWCNLGAGTSNSNLKNNASEISILPKPGSAPVAVGLKCGLIMGDYSRSAINTTFNTGTVVGVCCHIFGGMPPKFVPSFTWGEEKYLIDKVIRDVDNWKQLKGLTVTEEEKNTLHKLYQS